MSEELNEIWHLAGEGDEIEPAEVFDVQGRRWSWNAARAKYGERLRALRPPVRNPKHFYLHSVRETVGPAVIVIRLWQDAPDSEIREPVITNVGNYWPNPGPDSGMKYVDGAASQWYSLALIRMVNSDGHYGYGLGGGSVIKGAGPEMGGPHCIWIVSPTATSDIIENVGWLGGTNHAGMMSLDFRLGVGEIIPDPPDPPDPPGPPGPTQFEISIGPIRVYVGVRRLTDAG